MKGLGKFIKIITMVLVVLITLTGMVVLSLNIPFVQKAVTRKINQVMAESELPISLGSIERILPYKLHVRGVLISGIEGDSLVYVEDVETVFSLTGFLRSRIDLDRLKVEHVRVRFSRSPEMEDLDIANAFSKDPPPGPPPPEKEKKQWVIMVGNGNLTDVGFQLSDVPGGLMVSQKLEELKLKGFSLSLMDKDLQLGSVELIHSEGGIVLSESTLPEKEGTGVPWNFGFNGVAMQEFVYSFDQSVDSMLIELQIEEGDIRSRELDMPGKLVDMDRLKLIGLKAFVFTGSNPEPLEAPPIDTPGQPFDFPWDIRGRDIMISQAVIGKGIRGNSNPGNGNPELVTDTEIYGIEIDVPRVHLSGSDILFRLKTLQFTSEDLVSLDQMKGELSSEAGSTQLNFTINTSNSQLNLAGTSDRFLMDLVNTPERAGHSSLEISETRISPKDLLEFVPDMNEAMWFSSVDGKPLMIGGRVTLNDSLLNISRVGFSQAGRFELNIEGTAIRPFQPEQMITDLNLEVAEVNSDWLKELLASAGISNEFNELNEITLNASVRDHYYAPSFQVSFISNLGSLIMNGQLNIREQRYDIRTVADRIALGKWLEQEQLGTFSGSVALTGEGFDPEQGESTVDLMLDSLLYNAYQYRDIALSGHLKEGNVQLDLVAEDSSFHSMVTASLYPFDTVFRATAEGHLAANLNELHLYEDTLRMETTFLAEINGSGQRTGAMMQLNDLILEIPDEKATIDSFQFNFQNDTSGLRLSADAGFLQLEATIDVPDDSLASIGIDYRNYLGSILSPESEVAGNRIAHLPALDINGSLSYHSAMGIFLEDTTLRFAALRFSLSNDLSGQSIHYQVHGDDLEFKTVRIKTLEAELVDSASALGLILSANYNRINETPIREIKVSSHYSDLENETAISVINRFDEILYKFELHSREDSNILVISVPSSQMIFNKEPWQMSSPELARIDLETRAFYPEFELYQGDSQIKLTSQDSTAKRQYRLGLNEVNLTSLVVDSIIPGNPQATITGNLFYESDTIAGMLMNSDLRLSDVAWSELALDSIVVSGKAESEGPGQLMANMEAFIDTSEISLNLIRRDSTIQSLDADFNALPLKTLQPFVNQYVTHLKGSVSGSLDIIPEGNTESFDGEIAFHNAALRVKPLNAMYKIRDNNLTFKNNRLEFNRFNVLDTMDNNLQLDGFVDISNRTAPVVNMDITSTRIQVMNRTEEEEGPLYGNAYIDSRLTIRGPLKSPDIKGKLILSGESDLYYRQMEDLSLSESEKIITFVRPTPQGTPTPALPGSRLSRTGKISVETTLEIDPSARVHFNLSKRIYNISLAIQGGGSLNYQMQGRNQMSLSGRYQINEGSAEVKIVGWPNKTFTITEEGYIQWEGKVEDPDLNLEAVNSIRTSYLNPVDGKQREVDFNVVLKVNGRLSELGIMFAVNTPDQYLMSIINTLSPEEQMRQAISVLLFESIDLPGISSNNNYMTEQVNQLLASQMNQIAKTSIQGVDVSFGIDSYQQATEGGGEEMRTSLSYEVKKDFMEGRAQVEVSGRLNDLYNQPGASDFSLNNISFEYQLDSSGTKFLKVYNEHNYEDVFEGEIVATGIGFTYRKRYSRLVDIWRRKNKGSR